MASLPEGSVFCCKKLLTHAGELVDAETALADKKVVLCYFSAHWCPPCRQFTPKLKDFYEELSDSPLAIIFVSSDRDEQSMKDYFKDHGSYFAVPFSDTELVKALKQNCGVSGIPMLAVIDKKGQMLHGNGRADVTSGSPAQTYKKWEELSSKA